MLKHTLIITEKPDAALRIATALDEREHPQKMNANGVPYYIANRTGKVIVVPALGHLYTIVGVKKGRDYPVFEFKWVPRHLAERGADRTKTWIQTISDLARDADILIDACDYDAEGCIIGYCILKYACDGRERTSKRMKFSTLTKREIEEAYEKPLQHLDFGLIEAGLTRHEVDWLYGINLSRALMTALKKASGRFTALSTGRVQGPSLRFLINREETINSFVPLPHWKLAAQVQIGGEYFQAKYEKDEIRTEKEAIRMVNECKNLNGQISEVNIQESRPPPPVPFDLGTLQNEAYRLFKYTPHFTLSVAQRLYLNALISYPRTDSQQLPSTIEYRTILQSLSRAEVYKKPAERLLAKQTLKPNEGQKNDPAHPAIYPTGNLPEKKLNVSERRVWDLIVRRFFAVFGEPATKQNTKATIKVGPYNFLITGSLVIKEGWMQYYKPYCKLQEAILPPVKEGQCVNIEVWSENRFSEPPHRFNPSSLLREMEKAGIGTKATRAEIIQTLNNRGYVEGRELTVTNLGFEIGEILGKYFPSLVSPLMTRELESKMAEVQENRQKREYVVNDVVATLRSILETFRENETKIGQQLKTAIEKAELQERVVGPCPTCKSGRLFINYSRKSGKRFVGCTNYFKGICKTSFPLPQKGSVNPTSKSCTECGWPTVEVRTGRRPWILCFNDECQSKARSSIA